MKKIILKILIASFFFVGCTSKQEISIQEDLPQVETTVSEIATPSTSGQLHVEGNQLVDENGMVVQLKGISTHGIGWFGQYVNEACFKQLRQEWNVNVIRLALYTDEENGYCTNGNKEELKQIVKNGIEYATNQDMYVIVDWHVLHDQNPNKYKEEACQFFDEISSEYANNNNILYEICNEPNGNTGWKEIQEYANEVIPVIRKNAKDSIVIVGTPNWSQFVDQAAANPLSQSNVMYALHYYAATHKEDLRKKMIQVYQSGLPIFVSEYGICDASGNGMIDLDQANAWIDVMNQYHISYVNWNLSNKDESSAILKADCTKTNGFTVDDLSTSGKWLYSMLTNTKLEEPNVENELNSNGIDVQYNLKNSWEVNGVMYYQYDLTLSSNQSLDSWEIKVPFEGEFELSDSWNGKYKVEQDCLIISNESYNGTLNSNTVVKDVGFIVTNKIK